jgi:tetratricopeptide (TPR) repeat protein
MRGRCRLPLLLAGLVLAGCAGTLEKGDVAFSRGDWDEAVALYQEALGGELEAGRRGQVQARLDESRLRAGAAHAAESSRLEAAGDGEGAVREAEAAYRLSPSDATASRLADARRGQAARLLARGRASLEAGDHEAAVRHLTAALALSPGDEGQELLARAQDAAEGARRGAYWSAVEAGNRAMAARDWNAAVDHFAAAHRSGATEDSLRREAFCKAMREAEAAAAVGDERRARSRFEEALLWGIDTEFVRSRREATEEARKRAFETGVEEGTKAMAARDWDAAVSRFNVAHRAGHSDDSLRREAFCKAMQEAEAAAASGDERRARARFEEALLWGFDTEFVKTRRDAADQSRRRAFAESVEAAGKAMAERDWRRAVDHFAAAHRSETTEDSLRRELFCKAMLGAETAAAAGDERMARARFEEALRSGLDAEFVRARMALVLPGEFVLTIHDGVILPFKPGSRGAWDGTEGTPLPGADAILAALAALKPGEAGAVAKASEAVGAGAALDAEAPDTYLIVTMGSQTFSSRQWIRHDACRPSWEFRIPLRGRASDAGTLSVAVFDRDGDIDDRIGSFEIPAAELFAAPGTREVLLVDGEGKLRGGGLVAVRYSVQRQ